MQFIPIKTRKFLPPKDNLYNLLDEFLPTLKEKDVLLISSKIVSIHQGRCLKINPNLPPLQQKIKLIKKEADAYFKDNPHSLTLKDQTLTPYAGIDRSNANNHYVLWPKQPNKTAKKVWQYLRKKHQLKNLGIIIIDSFCLPLRWGHMGISIGFYGFHPNFGGVLMGEGSEQTPMLLVRNFNSIKFTSKDTSNQLKIPKNKSDFYQPLFKAFNSKT